MGTEDPRTAAPPAPSSSKIDWDRARKHWAFQPVPKFAKSHSIDGLINARILQAKLQPAPGTDRANLLRRITYDLTGSPPAPAELRAVLRLTAIRKPI